YEATDLFPNGRALQLPPEHTVAREAQLDEAQPAHLDRAAIARGRKSFEVFCATCHGIRGDGDSAVAAKMELRKPPSTLVDAHGRARSPEHIYRTISSGFGLMRAYDVDLDVAQRWEIVAYVRALQIAQGVELDRLPAPIRDEAQRRLAP